MMAAMQNASYDISLKQLLSDVMPHAYLPDIPVKGLTLDSRKVQDGYVFVALSGQTEHGLTFAQDAIKNGAVAVLCDKKFDQYCQQIVSNILSRVICIAVDDLLIHLGDIASRFYGEPSKQLFTVGITGTDGKTSVSHFIAQALQQNNEPSSVIGTIGNGLLNNLQAATHTTPDVIDVHKILADNVQKNATSVAMEVSSHGLHQRRVDGVEFDVAVLTNLGRDHLDYHDDLDAYKAAKQLLFQQQQVKALVLNVDDEFGRELAEKSLPHQDVWTYGLCDYQNDNHVKASQIKTQATGLQFYVQTPIGEADVNLNLLGEFNIANALATLCVLLIKGVEFNDAISRLEKLHTVTGRMQSISLPHQPIVVVDFAHTPQALGFALKSLRKHCKKILHCVFGCGGDRDQGKRPLMAAAVESLADNIIVTQDNPRNEDPAQIFAQIKKGFKQFENVQFIDDRQQAIEAAIYNADEDDIVLIAGKGHEQYQLVAGQSLPFDDSKIARTALSKKTSGGQS